MPDEQSRRTQVPCQQSNHPSSSDLHQGPRQAPRPWASAYQTLEGWNNGQKQEKERGQDGSRALFSILLLDETGRPTEPVCEWTWTQYQFISAFPPISVRLQRWLVFIYFHFSLSSREFSSFLVAAATFRAALDLAKVKFPGVIAERQKWTQDGNRARIPWGSEIKMSTVNMAFVELSQRQEKYKLSELGVFRWSSLVGSKRKQNLYSGLKAMQCFYKQIFFTIYSI